MRRNILLFIPAVAALSAQTQVDLVTQTKQVDFTRAVSTKPFKTGSALPSTCQTGDVYLKVDAIAGANVYACTGVNTWTVQAGSGIPYNGAAQSVDLGAWSMKAATVTAGSSGQPTRISVTQGVCPTAADTGYDYTLCMENGVLHQVSSGGVKSQVGGGIQSTSVRGDQSVFAIENGPNTLYRLVSTGGNAHNGYNSLLFQDTTAAYLILPLNPKTTCALKLGVQSVLDMWTSGNGTYVLAVSAAYGRFGATDLYGSLTFGSESALQHTASGANYGKGFYDLVTLSPSGSCTANTDGQVVVLRFRRAKTTYTADTAGDLVGLVSMVLEDAWQ